MARIRTIRTATPADEDALRACLREIPTEGRIPLVFEREPSFFGSLAVHESAEIIIAEGDGETLGFAMRAIDTLFVEGRLERVGYLGALRVRADARDARAIARGYKHLREMHHRDPVRLHLTTLQANNHAARTVLESGRLGIPPYVFLETIHSHVFSPRAPRPPASGSAGHACDVAPAHTIPPADIDAFVEAQAPRRNFTHAPHVYRADGPRTPGLSPADVLVATDGSRILGMLAFWRTTVFKQIRVMRYPPALRLARPAINALAPLTRRPWVPPAPSVLDTVYASFPLVADDDPTVLARLLLEGCRTLPKTTHVVLGICGSDPLLAALDFPAMREQFRLYTVRFTDDEPTLTRPPYVEGAML